MSLLLTKFRKLSLIYQGVVGTALLHLPHRKSSSVRSGLIVSLTSFPARIESVWQTIATINRQSIRPEKIVLVLAEAEFPGKVIPESLSSGEVEIMWVEHNTRSYKKLIPVLKAYPSHVIVTADDDILYPRWWLDALIKGHDEHPDAIVGLRGAEIKIRDGVIAPYKSWPGATQKTLPSKTFLKGDGGILYPPNSLAQAVFDESLALKLCPHADDVWFKVMSLVAGTQVKRIMDGDFDLPTILNSQTITLRSVNVERNANDVQFDKCLRHFHVMDKIMKYAEIAGGEFS